MSCRQTYAPEKHLPSLQHCFHLRNFFLLASYDLRAKLLDLSVGYRSLVAHEDGAGMVGNHGPQELRVPHGDLLPDSGPKEDHSNYANAYDYGGQLLFSYIALVTTSSITTIGAAIMAHDRMDDDEIPLTHEFLALMLAVRRPGVTVAMQKLQSQALIRFNRGVIVITDRKGLQKIAGGLHGVPETEYRRLTGWRSATNR